MADGSVNNKRIAQNTLFLYFRMLFMMAITLFTNRVVLDKLGVVDYGIYNIVGGIIVMLGFLSGCMSNSIQRFLSYELGRGNMNQVNRIFNISILVHLGIALLVFIVMELIGLWYLNTYMNIPHERLNAANWVFQCSLLTMLFTIMQVPYNALIISKEKMGIYAYISIVEAILKLLVVYLLSVTVFDRLKFYSVLISLVTIGILLSYKIYCKKNFEEASFRIVKDWHLFKEIISFSGWNMLSEVAWTLTGPGVNLILNSFYGPVINAARGLAEQVNAAVTRFVSNFQTAVNPQIIKSYAAGEIEQMNSLLFRSTRFSFYLLYILSLPLILKMDFILHIWLKEVPTYTTEFCQLILVCSLISVNSTLLPKIAWAYGKIRKYQVLVSFVLILNFPFSYLFLQLGFTPISTVWVAIVIQVIIIYVRLYLVSKMVELSITQYIKQVLFNNLCVATVALIFPYIISLLIKDDIIGFFIIIFSAIASVSATCYFIGMKSEEKDFVWSQISKIRNHHCFKF